MQIYNTLSQPVVARCDRVPHLNGKLHYHAENELIYFREGEGVQQVGDYFSRFKKGDLLLVGENLAHYWKFNAASGRNKIDTVVIHFKPDFLGKDFLETNEAVVIKTLLNRAQQGLFVKGRVKEQVIRLMEALLPAKGLSRSVILLTILEKIATRANLQTLNAFPYGQHGMTGTEPDAITAVYKYVCAHFTDKITLQEISAVAHLSPNSFCRFFKKHTGKTFVHFLLEVRVAHACKLLSEKRKSLKMISHESGFRNMTCFYRYFKLITRKTPRDYRDSITGSMPVLYAARAADSNSLISQLYE